MSQENKFDRFGRYLILDHLVDGGMAKICRARLLGEEVDKVVAIKMIRPQLSSDESFKQMFMDEIKVTFGLIHPNIVQTYDYGYHDNALYVAMEYCDGKNLKEYLNKLKEKKYIFPIEISTHIIIEASKGLQYAHTFTDQLSGEKRPIIHRDISPHNIMLTFGGAIKLIDFGIAKSDTNSESTQVGTIKGKISYLAPEYLEGLELDPRYDLFSMAITFWEMLCNKKLFEAPNDLAVLKKIQECNIPSPSSVNSKVPKALDEIIMKALSKDRSKRFKDLEEFIRALTKFLYSSYPDFSSSDLLYFSSKLFNKEIKEDKEKMIEFGKIDINFYMQEFLNEQKNNSISDDKSQNIQLVKEKINESELDFDFNQDNKKIIPITEETKTKDLSKVHVQKLDLTSKSINNKIKINKNKSEKPVARQVKKRPFVKIALSSLLTYIIYSHYFQIDPHSNTSSHSQEKASSLKNEERLSRVPAGENKLATIRLINFVREYKVYINGKRQEVNHFNDIKVKSDYPFTLRVMIPKHEHFIKKNLMVSPSKTLKITITDTPITSFGYLTTSHACFKGRIIFNILGEERTQGIPFKKEIAFPTNMNRDGSSVTKIYDIILEDKNTKIRRTKQVSFQEGKIFNLCKIL